MGLEVVPVHIASELNPHQVAAYRLADNRSSEDSVWDTALLALEIGDLAAAEYDLSLLGFSEDELSQSLAIASATDNPDSEDDVPEPPEIPKTVIGDVWVMSGHRIICGDSTDADVVSNLLGNVEPHLMVTDPPYGVDYDANWRNKAMRSDGSLIKGRAIGKVLNDDICDWREAWALFPGCVAYVWHAGLHAGSVAESLKACDFELRSQIIWAKTRFAISRGDYHWQHEPCWYAVKKSQKGHTNGDRTQSTLWTISHTKSDTGHSTQKPVECMRRPIENNSSPGQAVYDPFSGSGTTIIAAENTGRCCYAVELNPLYVDVSVMRWQDFTGKTAIRESDGVSFSDA